MFRSILLVSAAVLTLASSGAYAYDGDDGLGQRGQISDPVQQGDFERHRPLPVDGKMIDPGFSTGHSEVVKKPAKSDDAMADCKALQAKGFNIGCMTRAKR